MSAMTQHKINLVLTFAKNDRKSVEVGTVTFCLDTCQIKLTRSIGVVSVYMPCDVASYVCVF